MTGRFLLVAMMLLTTAAAPPPRTPKAGPATQPSALIADAIAAAGAGKLGELVPKVEQQLRPALWSTDEKDLPQITQLVALRQFAGYFSRLPRQGMKELDVKTLQWLAAQPNLLNALMTTVGENDDPANVLTILTALRLDKGDALEQFPDLVTALCVVWDQPQQTRNEVEPKPLDVERPRMLLRYYMSGVGRLQFDPRILPAPLAVYVVDNVVSEEEIAWAVQRYGKRGAIGGVYFDVPYDYNVYYGTGSNLASARGKAYTLPNLTLMGGVCADQAYFATQVARCLGIPAAIAAGRGGSGDASHAWVGYLEIRGKQALWNWDSGRYPEYQFFKGRVIDPQTRGMLTEADVSLLAGLFDTAPARRLGSAALTQAADLIGEATRANYLMRAINYSPGNRNAWLALSDMGAKSTLTEAQAKQFKQVIAQTAARQYPDFALAMLLNLISGKPAGDQLAELDQFRPLFAGTRPDIQAALSGAKGDLLRKENRASDALAVYGEALSRYASVGPIAMDMLDRVDNLLREVGEMRRLAEVYQFVWGRMAQPETSAYVKTTPFYIIGSRYEAVLREAGDVDKAKLVESRLDMMTAATDTRNSSNRRR